MHAQTMANDIGQKHSFDPITVLMIIQIMVELYKLYQECNKTEPSEAQVKRRIRIATKRVLSGPEYSAYGSVIEDELFNIKSQYSWNEFANAKFD